ncbi:GTP cyclohydrolase I FolE [Sunxiuqinia elliptica]|uniref:GTP cyclohydrolase 1 n=1 Tax=Sunxiuqinia elliptica TaxID=655355 RepID=A0A1I2KRQ9_9BACT|nr:GTP cyclohydrolase I FolE [Sunxiuqinia elliptica]TDN97763.1 GTP cyclohydrolase I [Sunxiuqinia elliptica]TDO55841.1 GTP cyclohydrolase I [Sunxiuqinia elliptica]SFF69203.1 GTP cyclohydrolase I [Sunxiuqinia elliptica]
MKVNGFVKTNRPTTAKNSRVNGHLVQNRVDNDLIGDNHIATSIDTPMRSDAFKLTDNEKMEIIEDKFREIMDTLGLDLNDDSLSGTPHRVAKMFVQEIFNGLNPANKPKISVFENKFKYGEMLVEKNINLNSTCEHHFLPIVGKAHVAYVSSGQVIGLSKINRIVDYYARRPQVQERLTVQVANELKKILKTEDVAVVIDAKHMCVSSRGIEDESSSTVTAEYGGIFKDKERKEEFLKYVTLGS